MHADQGPAFAHDQLAARRCRRPPHRDEATLPPPDAGRCLQACREVEAARLLLAELARRHGPMD